MKKLLHIALIIGAVGALMCSCEPEPKVDGVAEIKSLTITATANEALTQDCAAIIDQTAATILVALPMNTDKSALVPTFTTTDGDVVTVAGAEVKSGESALDLTEGVEVVVTDASSNATKTYTLSTADNDGKAELLSVGFLAKDNAGKLTEDVVAEEIADQMVLRIAGGGVGVELVMSFTAGLNDIVTVNNAEAVATTAVDCTFPIDITVSDPYAGVEKKYVVKVGKILQNAGWAELGALDLADTGTKFDFAVDNVKDEIYLAHMSTIGEGENMIDDRASVLKWNGSAFVQHGANNFTDAKISLIDIAAHDGALYAIVGDSGAEVSGTPSVYKYDGAWSVLGPRGFGEKISTSYYVAGVNPANNQPVAVYQCSDSKSTTVPRRGAIYSEWNGSAWNTNISMPVSGHNAAWYCYNPRITTHGDAMYVFIHLQDQKSVVVYKLENGAWTTVVDKFLPTGATNINMRGGDMAVAANGDVFVLIADDSVTNDTYMWQVYKVTADGMVKVGTPLYDIDDGRQGALTTDTNNNPVVAYRTDSDDATKEGFVNIVSIDNDTQTWGEPFVIEKITNSGRPIYLEKADNGNLYLAIEEDLAEGYRYVVYKNGLEADVLPE